MHRLAVVAILAVLGSTARADPEPPPPQPPPSDALVSWVYGTRVAPPLGMIGTMAVGPAHPWFMCAIDIQTGVRVGPVALIGEGEMDVPMDDSKILMLRAGAQLRLALWRHRGPWSAWTPAKRGGAQSRSVMDLFVEGGVGEEAISGSAISLDRRDLEVGAGIGFGNGFRGRDAKGASSSAEMALYIRFRILVADRPADMSPVEAAVSGAPTGSPGRDLGFFVDLGAVRQ
jgi:hypothetical protein